MKGVLHRRGGKVSRVRLLGPFGSVAGGSALGQVALAASLPVIARLYTPAEVGAFAVLLANALVASIILTGRLEQVLPRLPDERRWVVARLVLVSGTVFAPLAGALLVLLSGRSGLLELVMVTVLVASLCLLNVATFALLSSREYTVVAMLRISNGVVTGGCQVVGGIVHPDVWVMLLSYALGNLVASVLSIPALLRLRRSGRTESFRRVSSEEHLGRFAGSVGTGAVLSNLGLALPLIGVSLAFGDAAAGSFFLARRLLMVPTQLVAASVSEVSYAMVARESMERIAAHVRGWLATARSVVVILLVVGFASAPIVPLIVGPGYEDIGWVVALLTLPAAAQMVATSFSNILLALHMELVRVFWNVGRLAGLLMIFWWIQESGMGFLSAVAVFAVYTVIAYAGLLVITLRGLSARMAAQ